MALVRFKSGTKDRIRATIRLDTDEVIAREVFKKKVGLRTWQRSETGVSVASMNRLMAAFAGYSAAHDLPPIATDDDIEPSTTDEQDSPGAAADQISEAGDKDVTSKVSGKVTQIVDPTPTLVAISVLVFGALLATAYAYVCSFDVTNTILPAYEEADDPLVLSSVRLDQITPPETWWPDPLWDTIVNSRPEQLHGDEKWGYVESRRQATDYVGSGQFVFASAALISSAFAGEDPSIVFRSEGFAHLVRVIVVGETSGAIIAEADNVDAISGAVDLDQLQLPPCVTLDLPSSSVENGENLRLVVVAAPLAPLTNDQFSAQHVVYYQIHTQEP